MNITVTIDLSQDVKDLIKGFVAKLGGSVQVEAPAAAAATKKTKAPSEEVKTPLVEEVKTEAPAATVVEFTVEQVREIASKKIKDEDKQPQVKALLTEFGAKSLTNLKPEQYAPFVTRLKAV